jgi:hypothetical protein
MGKTLWSPPINAFEILHVVAALVEQVARR